MDGRNVLGFKSLGIEMKSESGQQEHVTEGVEVTYVGRCIVVGSVTEVSNDRIDAEKQVGSNTIDGGLTKALAGLAKVFVPGIDYGVHARA